MDNTLFLAQIWGPVMLAIGLGVYTSRDYYIKVYRDLQKETLAVLIFAMAAMAAGIAQILSHNVWGTLPEIIISFVGWGLFIKGAFFAMIPHVVDRLGDWQADSKLIPFAGVAMIILGAYLTWFAYFM